MIVTEEMVSRADSLLSRSGRCIPDSVIRMAIEAALAAAPQADEDQHKCFICGEPFKLDDICASDINEGPCHATCLEGSPVVDLETGDPIPGAKVDTYPYRDIADPPHVVATTAPQPVASVNLLEWDDEDYCPSAKCAFGHYVIHPLYCHVELLFGYGGSVMTSLCRIELDAGATIDELKAAAQADYEARIRSALSAQAQDVERYRHKKRGTEYSVIARGRLQVDGDLDNEKIVIYRGDDGQTWGRPEYEFNDGRFEQIAAAPAAKQDAADLAYKEARSLAVSLHKQHYSEVTQWQPLDDIRGVISQIDNMTTDLVSRTRLKIAFRRALSDLPEIAPPEIRAVLSSVHMSDVFVNEGRRLQRVHGLNAVAPRVEQECGAGAWSLMRNGVFAAKEGRTPNDADQSTKAAELERLRFEGELDKWMKIIGAGITGYQPEAYAAMDAACEELVRSRAWLEEAMRALPDIIRNAGLAARDKILERIAGEGSVDNDLADELASIVEASVSATRATLEKIKARIAV
ncbi:hypothetical protein G6K96_21785 [Agrobacterium vitis]|uniref:hypothetical protein n=1 Tax=Agrobacterium vitis TaxID=373 RepID=UPI0015738DCE|nr:hypothetical protein [Agrobacterium vitis]NTA34367.1 hypothetical protein [Agrobacterium vitis]